MKLWINHKYEATVEDGESEADHNKMDDIIIDCLNAADAAIVAAAEKEGIAVRFTFD